MCKALTHVGCCLKAVHPFKFESFPTPYSSVTLNACFTNGFIQDVTKVSIPIPQLRDVNYECFMSDFKRIVHSVKAEEKLKMGRGKKKKKSEGERKKKERKGEIQIKKKEREKGSKSKRKKDRQIKLEREKGSKKGRNTNKKESKKKVRKKTKKGERDKGVNGV